MKRPRLVAPPASRAAAEKSNRSVRLRTRDLSCTGYPIGSRGEGVPKAGGNQRPEGRQAGARHRLAQPRHSGALAARPRPRWRWARRLLLAAAPRTDRCHVGPPIQPPCPARPCRPAMPGCSPAPPHPPLLPTRAHLRHAAKGSQLGVGDEEGGGNLDAARARHHRMRHLVHQLQHGGHEMFSFLIVYILIVKHSRGGGVGHRRFQWGGAGGQGSRGGRGSAAGAPLRRGRPRLARRLPLCRASRRRARLAGKRRVLTPHTRARLARPMHPCRHCSQPWPGPLQYLGQQGDQEHVAGGGEEGEGVVSLQPRRQQVGVQVGGVGQPQQRLLRRATRAEKQHG